MCYQRDNEIARLKSKSKSTDEDFRDKNEEATLLRWEVRSLIFLDSKNIFKSEQASRKWEQKYNNLHQKYEEELGHWKVELALAKSNVGDILDQESFTSFSPLQKSKKLYILERN